MEKRLLFFTLLLGVWGIYAMGPNSATNTDNYPVTNLDNTDSVAAVSTIPTAVNVDSEEPEESKEGGEAKENNSRSAQEFNDRLWAVGHALITSSALSFYQVNDINDLEALLVYGKTQGVLNSETCNRLLLEALELLPWVVFGNENETYFEMCNKMVTQALQFIINPINSLESYAGLIKLLIEYGANPGAVRKDNNTILQTLFIADIRRDCLKRTSRLNDQERVQGIIFMPNPAVKSILAILCNTDFSIDHKNAEGLTLEDMICSNIYNSPMDMSYVMGQHLSQVIAKKKLQHKRGHVEKQNSCAIS